MDEDVEYSIKDLEKCSYRGLQRLAKSLQLPSNVKKIYLIQLIHAKKHCSEADVEAIVHRVRLERQLAGQASKRKGKKKMRLQGTEVSSTGICHSPPISSTPKRPGLVICNTFNQTFPRPQISRVFSQSKSDRVLRSFNMNSYKRPRYSYMNDAVIGVIKAPKKESYSEASVASPDGNFPKLSLATRCIVRKLRPSISGGVSCLKRDNRLMSVSSREVCLNLSNNRPKTPEASIKDFECVPSFGFRRQDGKISKINAMVQKPRTKPEIETTSTETCSSIEVTVQDITNSSIDNHVFTNTTILDYGFSEPHYPNISNASDYSNDQIEVETTQNCDMKPQNPSTEKGTDPEESFSVYFHKKIRARETEQVKQRMQKPVQERERDRLPRIEEVFTTFQNSFTRDVTEPLYVQVGEDSERSIGGATSNYPTQMTTTGANMQILETLYNFKSVMLVNPPPYPVVTTSATQCTFSTSLVPRVTAVAQSSTIEEEIPRESLYDPDKQYPSASEELNRLSEYLRSTEQDITLRKHHEAATAPPESQDADAGPSAAEMVEDALELISQDGDYMERISMDVRMQCILCSWAGPKFVLDLHVEKEHASDIVKQDSSDWNTTYRLGSLSEQPLWLSEVREFDDRRYALSVKREANWILVSLSTLTLDPDPKKGTITIYNKVTGEPYIWEGPIQLLPTNMPYEHDGSYLRVCIEQLDLVPRSSELKNTNKVVGRIDLNEVYVIIFVKITESDVRS